VSLLERLRERIAREGPMSFADFMEAALFDPDEGYYSRGASIGEGGDFVTSPSVSTAFAGAFARLFAIDSDRLGPGPLDFVEVGAGDGRFLADFARWLGRMDPELSARVRLTAVEASAAGREAIGRQEVAPAPRILASVDELPEGSLAGWIFSNELYDALPVVRVVGSPEGVRELRVGRAPEGGAGADSASDGLAWVSVRAPPALVAHLEGLGVTLAPGQIGEIAPGAEALHRRLARSLARGWIVTVDYGHPARILYHPHARPAGTLSVHVAGRRGGDPLASPGSQDLTAHVNWDLLLRAGEAEGMRVERLVRQGIFLTESGVFDFAANDAEKWRVYRLVDPGGMGEEISVLIQSKGVAGATKTI
jgi:SAM-dependent MidA family methyltransferase